MYSVPLGIMFGADVSQPYFIFIISTWHAGISCLQLTPAQYIRKWTTSFFWDLREADSGIRSLLASFFGNIVGALFVALPATYMYLSDLGAGGYGKAENGEAGLSGSVSETRSDEPTKIL